LARAKRTDRTEARRRRRAAQLAAEPELTAPEPDAEVAPAPARRRGTAPAATQEPGQKQGPRSAPAPRPGITASLRAAWRPVNLREDVAGIPLLVMQPGVFGTMIAAAIVSVLFAVAYSPAISNIAAGDSPSLTKVVVDNQLPYLLLNLMVMPPPAAGAFLVGYFAKRSAWLGGLLFGLVAALCFTVLVLTPAGRLLTGDNDKTVYVVQAWLLGPTGAVLFAAASAWYRRFLRMATPTRPQQQRGGTSRTAKAAKPVQGRGDAPRNRLSGGSR
jgi:hypothetical protein